MTTEDPNIDLEEQIRTKAEKRKELRRKIKKMCLINLLTITTLIAVLLGIVFGIALKPTKKNWTQRDIMYVRFIGYIFLRMLKCLVLPLIVTTLVTAVADIDVSLSSKIAYRTISYYLGTTFAAVLLGIVLVSIIRPGENYKATDGNKKTAPVRETTTVDSMLDLVR